eukprot:5689415-Pleurochrysis_carterae.AAC.1
MLTEAAAPTAKAGAAPTTGVMPMAGAEPYDVEEFDVEEFHEDMMTAPEEMAEEAVEPEV